MGKRSIINKLNHFSDYDLSFYKTISIKEILNYFDNNSKYLVQKSIIIIEKKKNKIGIRKEYLLESTHFLKMSRIKIYIQVFEIVLENIENITFFFSFGDNLPRNFPKHLPIFVFVKSKYGILIPHYELFKTNIRHEDFDTTKKYIHEKDINWNEKKKKFFFFGSPSSFLRQYLNEKQKSNPIFKINLLDKSWKYNKTNKKFDISDNSEFKYLLDIGGSLDWSTKQIFMYLAKGLVIQIHNPKQLTQWHSRLLVENKDFLRINVNKLHYFSHQEKTYKIRSDSKKKTSKKTYERELIGVLRKKHKFLIKNDSEAKKIAESGFRKINSINNQVIYDSLKYVFKQYQQKVIP